MARLLEHWNRVRAIVKGPRRYHRLMQHLMMHELHKHKEHVWGHPRHIVLDLGPVCNLRCPFCATGNGVSKLPKEFLMPDLFEKIWANLPVHMFDTASFFNWGEPFLNPHVHEYVRRFHDANLWTVIHTNFSVRIYDDRFLEAIIDSRLDDLTVSVDGASQEAYGKYRINGCLATVLANMRRLNELKKTRNVDHPKVTYKMLLNRFTEPEVQQAQALAEEVGAHLWLDDRFYADPDVAREWLAPSVLEKSAGATATPPAFYANNDGLIDTYCRQLWDTLYIHSTGDIFPCCLICDLDHSVGNLACESFAEIWNNEKVRYLRRYVTDPKTPAPDFVNACATCRDRFCRLENQYPSGSALPLNTQ